LQGPMNHMFGGNGGADDVILPFEITATDGDGDRVELKFNVHVADDTPSPAARELQVNEDESVSFSNADISTDTVTVHGATLEPTPDANGNAVWVLDDGHGNVLI